MLPWLSRQCLQGGVSWGDIDIHLLQFERWATGLWLGALCLLWHSQAGQRVDGLCSSNKGLQSLLTSCHNLLVDIFCQKRRRAESKGCTENGNQAWGQIPKPVRMWLRPTRFCKAALQVLLPPIFNQSTSSSSQLRQQAPLLQPHHSGPLSSCCSALLRHTLPAGNTRAQVLKPCKTTAKHRRSTSCWRLIHVLQHSCLFPGTGCLFPRHRVPFPSTGCLWLDYRKQRTAMTSPGHSKKKQQSKSVTYA